MHKAPLLRILFGLLIGGTAIAAEVHKPLALQKGTISLYWFRHGKPNESLRTFRDRVAIAFSKARLTIRNIGDEETHLPVLLVENFQQFAFLEQSHMSKLSIV